MKRAATVVVATLGAIQAVAQPLLGQPLHETKASHLTGLWHIDAKWNVPPSKKSNPVVHSPDDLTQVTVEFDPSAAAAANQWNAESGDLTIRIEAMDRNGKPIELAREALRFFWRPKYVWNSEKRTYPKRTPATVPNTEWAKGRFALVEEPEDGDNLAAECGAFVKVNKPPPDNWYHAYSHNRVVPHPASMPAFLKLMKEVGTARRGRVFWLVEPGQPPERAALVWQLDGTAWGGAKISSPAWPSDAPYTLETFEPPGEVLPSDPTDGRTGLVPLPPGTWERLKGCGSGGTIPVVIGKEGLVIQKGSDTSPVYEVHLLTRPPEPAGYVQTPLRTHGLGPDAPPPPWTDQFALELFSAAQARHLVALAVCSPGVWKKVRSTDTVPPAHRRPLFADPELWACPPIK